jgi:hypothetical protein
MTVSTSARQRDRLAGEERTGDVGDAKRPDDHPERWRQHVECGVQADAEWFARVRVQRFLYGYKDAAGSLGRLRRGDQPARPVRRALSRPSVRPGPVRAGRADSNAGWTLREVAHHVAGVTWYAQAVDRLAQLQYSAVA